MKKIITYIFIFLFFVGYSQKHEHKTDTIRKIYVPLKQYKKNYTKQLTKEDTLNFKFKDNDTMVMVNQYLHKGVYVPYEYKDSVFLKYYKKIAFNHDNGKFSFDTKMRYWKKPIKIFFSKNVSKNVQRELMRFASEVSSDIDSLNISRVNKLEDSNYVVYYKGGFEYEPRMHNYKNSSFYVYWNGKNQLYRNTIRINTDKEFSEILIINEVKKLFFQSLGRFKLIDEFECENYFADCHSKNKNFSKLDLEILKYHYSYGICKGTDLLTFEEQHAQAKETLKLHNHKVNFIHTE
ncbi:MAG: hypothetical protein COA67_11015 [Lutibacter sp.]|nr:MAG: hypothetical protein COA67_11015 [Lutibacter sp.]